MKQQKQQQHKHTLKQKIIFLFLFLLLFQTAWNQAAGLGSWQPQHALKLPPQHEQLLSATPSRAELSIIAAAE